jgi:hypothetical protein
MLVHELCSNFEGIISPSFPFFVVSLCVAKETICIALSVGVGGGGSGGGGVGICQVKLPG